jgi:hypothetical protein
MSGLAADTCCVEVDAEVVGADYTSIFADAEDL